MNLDKYLDFEFKGGEHTAFERACRHSRMLYSTDDEMFNSFLEKTTRIELAIALASIGITTVVKLLGQRGMNQDPISDPGTVALLTKLRAKDPGIDTDLDGEDADGIRSLQLLCRKAPTVSTAVAAAATAPAAGSAEEEAGNATLAVAFYTRLEQTQGVRVKHDMHLDYALMAQMSNLQKKNGTINRRIGLTNIVVQNKKKRSEKDLGMGLKFIDDEGCVDDTKFKYNEVTVMLRTFFTSLAAVLSYEVDADSEQSGEVPVMASDGTGNKMCVAGTYSACLDLMFEIVHAIGLYPLRYADSIFRAALSKTMEFAGRHHFDRAVSLVIEYHPSAFRPSEEELREMDSSRTQITPRTPGGKTKSAGGGPPAKKKKIDASAPPCHGVAYNGTCKKEGCKFDHDQARCKAFAAANPDGPPRG